MTAVHSVVNPATEDVVASVVSSGVEETDAAVARARKASVAWREVAPADRARILRRFAEAVDGDPRVQQFDRSLANGFVGETARNVVPSAISPATRVSTRPVSPISWRSGR